MPWGLWKSGPSVDSRSLLRPLRALHWAGACCFRIITLDHFSRSLVTVTHRMTSDQRGPLRIFLLEHLIPQLGKCAHVWHIMGTAFCPEQAKGRKETLVYKCVLVPKGNCQVELPELTRHLLSQ